MDSSIEYGLYFHVPFCSAKCTYCAFNTYIDLDHLITPFVEALIREVQFIGSYGKNLLAKTIFFGGGTPSLLTPEHYERIFDTIHQVFTMVDDAEITLESNPNDLSYNYLSYLQEIGFNRISIGMQSANSLELQLFNRHHSLQTVIEAVNGCRRAGLDNINLDLIYGNPKQKLHDWRYSLEEALKLDVKHFSLYGLELKNGTPLRESVEQGIVPKPDDDLAADMYDLATDMLYEAGYEQYEISNWSRAGYESKHNLLYWYNAPYLAFGPGAHGYAQKVRYTIVRSPQRYINLLSSDCLDSLQFPLTPATAKHVIVDSHTDISETIMMGLRLTKQGIRRRSFEERFGVDLLELKFETIQKYVNYGLLHVDKERISLTQNGRLLSNIVIADLI